MRRVDVRAVLSAEFGQHRLPGNPADLQQDRHGAYDLLTLNMVGPRWVSRKTVSIHPISDDARYPFGKSHECIPLVRQADQSP